MVSAFLVSCVFLITYVLHKVLVHGVHTPIGAEGMIRNVYYTMLVSHIILAIVIVPLILITLRFAFTNRLIQHRQWATDHLSAVVLCFGDRRAGLLLLYQWFPHRRPG